MAVHVYHYTDPGAPVHPNATRGSMSALLRACLVDGYSLGEDVKYPAGWIELFSELNNFAAFQSLVGARQIFQVDDNQADADVAYINAGESLSGVDSAMIGKWGGTYFGKQYSGSYAKWHVIADEKTAYVILESRYGHVVHGFGEFHSLVPDDPHNSFLAGHTTASVLPTSEGSTPLHYSHSTGTDGNVHFHRSAIGTWAPDGCCTGTQDTYVFGSSIRNKDISESNVGLGFFTMPILLSCIIASEASHYYTRGKLRGVTYPIASRPLDHLEEYVDPTTGKNMICIHMQSRHTATYGGCLLFDLSGAW